MIMKNTSNIPQRRWVIENGIGHWEVMYKGRIITCDDGELTEIINELEEEN